MIDSESEILGHLNGEKNYLIIFEVTEMQKDVNQLIDFLVNKRQWNCTYLTANKPYAAIKKDLIERQEIFADKLQQRTAVSKDHIAELINSLQELKEKGKGKISDSIEMQITYLQHAFKNSKNLSRLYRKFPRTRFHYLDNLREKFSRNRK